MNTRDKFYETMRYPAGRQEGESIDPALKQANAKFVIQVRVIFDRLFHQPQIRFYFSHDKEDFNHWLLFIPFINNLSHVDLRKCGLSSTMSLLSIAMLCLILTTSPLFFVNSRTFLTTFRLFMAMYCLSLANSRLLTTCCLLLTIFPLLVTICCLSFGYLPGVVDLFRSMDPGLSLLRSCRNHTFISQKLPATGFGVGALSYMPLKRFLFQTRHFLQRFTCYFFAC